MTIRSVPTMRAGENEGDEMGPASMVTTADGAGRILAATPPLLAWLGRSVETVVGHSAQDWLDHVSWQRHRTLLEQARVDGRPATGLQTLVRPDGSTMTGAVTIATLDAPGSLPTVELCIYRTTGSAADSPAANAGEIGVRTARLAEMAASLNSPRLEGFLQDVSREAFAVAAMILARQRPN